MEEEEEEEEEEVATEGPSDLLGVSLSLVQMLPQMTWNAADELSQVSRFLVEGLTERMQWYLVEMMFPGKNKYAVELLT